MVNPATCVSDRRQLSRGSPSRSPAWPLSASRSRPLVAILGCAVIVAVTVTDLERRIVPNRIVLPALAVALVVQTLRDPGLEWILASLGAGGFFLVMALAYPAGLGMGDVKLAAFLGAWLGRDVAVALFVGSLLGALYAAARRRSSRLSGEEGDAAVRAGPRGRRRGRALLRRGATRRLAGLTGRRGRARRRHSGAGRPGRASV